jgi:hypothetical protein
LRLVDIFPRVFQPTVRVRREVNIVAEQPFRRDIVINLYEKALFANRCLKRIRTLAFKVLVQHKRISRRLNPEISHDHRQSPAAATARLRGYLHIIHRLRKFCLPVERSGTEIGKRAQ